MQEVDIHKKKKAKQKRKKYYPRIHLPYNYYVGPSDGWTFLGSADPSTDLRYTPLPSHVYVVFTELQLPPSCVVTNTQDPFDFIDPDTTSVEKEGDKRLSLVLFRRIIYIVVKWEEF